MRMKTDRDSTNPATTRGACRTTALLSVLLLLLLGLFGAVGCASNESGASELESGKAGEEEATDKKKTKEGEEDEEKEEAVPVEVASLTRGEIESVLRFSSNLEAESAVQVYAQASRLVFDLYVEEGDAVRKGDVLVRLQDEEQRSAVAKTDSQLSKARREHDRQRNLFAQELISEQALNDAAYELEQLEIAVQDARRELGYTEVRAPISGIVTSRLVKLGDHVTLNQHLFDIVDFDSIVARVYVPERELARVSVGQPARIHSDAWGEEYQDGAVDRIAPIVDPRTGTVKVTVATPRAERLLPGMYVDVELVTATHADALLVPKRALVFDGDQTYVFRVGEGDRVERLLVQPLLEDEENVEPRDGLEEGDRIVVAGQAGLKADSLVRVLGAKS